MEVELMDRPFRVFGGVDQLRNVWLDFPSRSEDDSVDPAPTLACRPLLNLCPFLREFADTTGSARQGFAMELCGGVGES